MTAPGKSLARLAVLLGWILTPGPVLADGAPALSLPELGTGNTVSLAQLQGEVVYVDFWASWCGPCRKSLPLYEQMAQELGETGFRIVAINLDEEREDAERFLAMHPVSYTVLLDPAGESAETWQIKAMPSSFLVDQNGNVARSWSGFKESHLEEIRSEIEALLP